jgi:uncharacterized protein YaaW (UPF0174 family)
MKKLFFLLIKASEEERQALADILEAKSSTVADITKALQWNASDKVAYHIINLFSAEGISYKEIIKKTLDKHKIQYKLYETEKELEIRLAQHVMETVWNKMTDEQKAEMEEQLQKEAARFDKTGETIAGGSIVAAMVAGNVSGFGVYLLASTSLGALTGWIGVTLPFAVYTGMSSVISVILGPVGWASLGLAAIWSVGSPNYQRLTQAILYISALRAKIEGGYQ